MLRICRCGCFGKKVQNLDIYSSWGQNASQLGHPENLRKPTGLRFGVSGGPGLRSKELANAAGRKADKWCGWPIFKWGRLKDVAPDIALCTMCQKWGRVNPIARFQVEVLRTLTKGAKISSDFQAQSCHCHVTIIVLVSTTCYPGRVVLLLWKCGETQGVSDFGWNEVEHESGSGGCFPKPWRSCCMNNPSFPMLGASWCYVWKQLGWGSLNGQR